MTKSPSPPQAQSAAEVWVIEAETLDELAFDVAALAQACRRSSAWVCEHIETGVIEAGSGDSPSHWRFSSTSVTRARRIAQLEAQFDADPHLAALTADLIEEVQRLRGLL